MQTRGGGPQLWKVCSKRDVDVNAASMQNNSRRKKSSTNFSRCKASRCNNILQTYKTHDQGITYFGKVTKSHHQTNKFVSWYILGEIDKHIKRMNKFVWIENWIPSAKFIVLFTILRPFETRESIRRKVYHGGQIVLWYWQHATNSARATVFVVCMSSARVLVWVRGRAKQKRSLCKVQLDVQHLIYWQGHRVCDALLALPTKAHRYCCLDVKT
jgi:hypothetical protein